MAVILGVSTSLLEKTYECSSLPIEENSVEHIVLRAQGISLPEEFDHFTFIPYSDLLYKDIGYLGELESGQITSLLSHNPTEWTYKLFPQLATGRAGSETELCLKTVSFSGRTVKLLSKQDLKFSNPIKLHELNQLSSHEVVLASDLTRAFRDCQFTDASLLKVCECLGLKTSQPSIADTRYIGLQRHDLTVEDIATMLLITYNRNLQLIMLLLGLGADPCQLLKLVTDADWSSFPNSITVLLTRPESLDNCEFINILTVYIVFLLFATTGLYEYLTNKSNNDEKFFDLSQEYNYYLIDVTHPVVTNVKKSASNCEIFPFQVWKYNSTGFVSVNFLKNLFESALPNYLPSEKEKLVS